MFIRTNEINRITLARVGKAAERSEHEAGHYGEGMDVLGGQRICKMKQKAHANDQTERKVVQFPVSQRQAPGRSHNHTGSDRKDLFCFVFLLMSPLLW